MALLGYLSYLLVWNAAYVAYATKKDRPFLEIPIIFLAYSTLYNVIFYFTPDLWKKSKELKITSPIIRFLSNSLPSILIEKAYSVINWILQIYSHWKKQARIIILKHGKKSKIIPLMVYSISGSLPIPILKEASLIVGRLQKIPFWIFIFINLLQFIVAFCIGKFIIS